MSAKARGTVRECARFCSGMFMNYLSIGLEDAGWGGEERGKEARAGLVDEPIIWDLAAGKAEVPVGDDGKTFPEVTMTEIGDIGRFVAAACELEDGMWEEEMGMVGETIKVDEVTRMVEEVAGIPLKIDSVDRKELERRAESVQGIGTTTEEILIKMVSQITLCVIGGTAPVKPTVNRLCPQVRPQSVRQYLEKWLKP